MDWTAMAEPWLKSEGPNEAALAPARAALMGRAQLRPGQHVLDVGPGPGASLLDAADAVTPAGRVTGIEVAPPLADRARARVPENVDVELGDAVTHPFGAKRFDAVVSSFGVMFFANPVAAFAHIQTACRPRSAMTFVCWGRRHKNPWFT
ncbi:class I SAM-dependent methyltransferase [Citreimonas salinaria]|uniref:Methyltransferase domain-containing protein n=1 Tax=Citreimonas salinaria TaxID=321339 RepID=A0A1H3P4L4_9RHOB|nr:class I SAM-dependent methyltransferase [Citreimonas salinaria]SDY96094.1 Methyltransferase domain-containing protein [Citreimonas salinaria]